MPRTTQRRRARATTRDADDFFRDLVGGGDVGPAEDLLARASDALTRARDELRARIGLPAASPAPATPMPVATPMPAMPVASPLPAPTAIAPQPTEDATTTYFRLRVDADRDGAVDGRDPPTRWTWGATGRGAAVLPNVDSDNPGPAVDTGNATIDAGNDATDIAPLRIEPVPSTTPPAGTQLELRVSPPGVVRVFDGTAPGATEIIGPTAGAHHRFTALPTAPLQLGMEALRLAGRGFDGLVEITLRTVLPSGRRLSQRTVVRVAPWIMPNHTHRAEAVFVVDVGASNRRFRTELRRLVTAAGCTLVEHADADRWMQDAMEFGVTNLPSAGFRTVLRAPRDRPLQSFPRTLLSADLGYTEQGTLRPDTTFDSHGNLEASPAVTVGGKFYRFGRIYYGPGRPHERLDPEIRAFLRAQLVQDPFEVDTNWLVVGHVDEVVTFVPTQATTGNRFKMLIACPRRAYAILDGLARTHPTAPMFAGRSLDGTTPLQTDVTTFLGLADDVHPLLRQLVAAGRVTHTARRLRRYNLDRQANLDAIRATMVRELGLTAADILEVPAIFIPNPHTPTLADALVPGMVNMLVINGHCIVPKPFGPVVSGVDKFEEDLSRQLVPLGLTVSFLDCWDEYHVMLGEVHCGTNTLRTPNRGRWWLYQP